MCSIQSQKMTKIYTLKSKVVVYPGMAAWRFLGLPKREAKEIKEKFGKHAKGWGSLPVKVTIGETKWETSIFPDKKSGTYVLPLKAQVRKKERIDDGETVQFTLALR
jgi:hypothetical protein